MSLSRWCSDGVIRRLWVRFPVVSISDVNARLATAQGVEGTRQETRQTSEEVSLVGHFEVETSGHMALIVHSETNMADMNYLYSFGDDFGTLLGIRDDEEELDESLEKL